MEIQRLAKYPYLKESVSYVKEKGPPLEELLFDPAYGQARMKGRERVWEAAENGLIEEQPLLNEEDFLLALLSYPIARMIVSCVGDGYLVKRYALAEARLASSRLAKESPEFLHLFALEFGIDLVMDGDIRMHFTDYLRHARELRAKEWKLVNQRMEKGYVILTKQRLIRLLQEALRRRINEELPLPVNETVLKAFQDDVRNLNKLLAEKKKTYEIEDVSLISVTRLPPCMQRLLAMIQAGENVPHTGRFALTAFLHNIGLSSDDIYKVYSTLPDFDDRMTRYQIDHITGIISGTEYTPPECSTMKSYGICFNPDSLCEQEWMTHPLIYYRRKGRKFKASSRSKAPSE